MKIILSNIPNVTEIMSRQEDSQNNEAYMYKVNVMRQLFKIINQVLSQNNFLKK